MRGQVGYLAALIAAMCAVRGGLAAYGYLYPDQLMDSLGASIASNPQMPYIVRVWAIRDVVLALLVVLARPQTIRGLLIACIAIDAGTEERATKHTHMVQEREEDRAG